LVRNGAGVIAGCLLVLAAGGAALPVAVAQPAAVAKAAHLKVMANCEHRHVQPTYKPRRIVAACGGDAVFILRHIRYHHWSRDRADAHGAVRYNSCEPDCATGRLVVNPARFFLVRPRVRAGRRVFTTVVVHSRRGPSGRYPLGPLSQRIRR
jgi:hypothetical protein